MHRVPATVTGDGRRGRSGGRLPAARSRSSPTRSRPGRPAGRPPGRSGASARRSPRPKPPTPVVWDEPEPAAPEVELTPPTGGLIALAHAAVRHPPAVAPDGRADAAGSHHVVRRPGGRRRRGQRAGVRHRLREPLVVVGAGEGDGHPAGAGVPDGRVSVRRQEGVAARTAAAAQPRASELEDVPRRPAGRPAHRTGRPKEPKLIGYYFKHPAETAEVEATSPFPDWKSQAYRFTDPGHPGSEVYTSAVSAG